MHTMSHHHLLHTLYYKHLMALNVSHHHAYYVTSSFTMSHHHLLHTLNYKHLEGVEVAGEQHGVDLTVHQHTAADEPDHAADHLNTRKAHVRTHVTTHVRTRIRTGRVTSDHAADHLR